MKDVARLPLRAGISACPVVDEGGAPEASRAASTAEPKTEVRTFSTTTPGRLASRDWLFAHGWAITLGAATECGVFRLAEVEALWSRARPRWIDGRISKSGR